MPVKEQHLKRRFAYSTAEVICHIFCLDFLLMTPMGMIGGLTYDLSRGL